LQPRRVVRHRPNNRGVWEISPSRTLEAVTEALIVRVEELSNLVLPPETAFLRMDGQDRRQKALKELWLKTELGKEIVYEVGACLILVISSMVSMSRSVLSMFVSRQIRGCN
jgi:hypothetical protein